jgi:hypothetical protein
MPAKHRGVAAMRVAEGDHRAHGALQRYRLRFGLAP